MSKLSEFLPFVKAQIAHNERCLKKFKVNSRGWRDCNKRVTQFTQLHDVIEQQDLDSPAQPPLNEKLPRLNLLPSDLEGLPPELVAELAISESDQADFQILAAVEANGGIASLDQILIRLFKTTGEIHKRSRLNSKLYRLSQKGMLKSVPGKKAVYALSLFDTDSIADTSDETDEERENDSLDI